MNDNNFKMCIDSVGSCKKASIKLLKSVYATSQTLLYCAKLFAEENNKHNENKKNNPRPVFIQAAGMMQIYIR